MSMILDLNVGTAVYRIGNTILLLLTSFCHVGTISPPVSFCLLNFMSMDFRLFLCFWHLYSALNRLSLAV